MTEGDDFNETEDGKPSTQSIRKLPADVDARGRWKSNRCMVDTYIDNSNPHPDAKVAAVLCVGGVIKYVVREGSQVSSEFILNNISANIAEIFPREAAFVLGTALLWTYHDEESSQLFPQPCVDKTKTKVAQLQGLIESNENPVKKCK